jgi:hypothetical protein
MSTTRPSRPRTPPWKRRLPTVLAIIALVCVVGLLAADLWPSGSHQSPAHGPLAALPPPRVVDRTTHLTTSIATVGPSQRFGEAVSASSGNLQVAAATSWLPTRAVVQTWQRSGSQPWSAPATPLPTGFHRSYDPSIATLDNGTIVVSEGADLAHRTFCLDSGSVAITRITSAGPTVPVIIDDQRGHSGFDDRPTVAAGYGSDVWAGWSHGSYAHSCDLVGGDDQLHVAISTDYGRTFEPSITIPSPGGNFGVQIAAIAQGEAFVAWTQYSTAGTYRIMVAEIHHGVLLHAPTAIGSGTIPPAPLPGASFPTFTVPSLIVVNNRPGLAWPSWIAGQSMVQIALPASTGTNWWRTILAPPAGEDFLVPALGLQPNGTVLLVSAAHLRASDAVRYDVRTIGTNPANGGLSVGAVHPLNIPLPGPGFRELGETLEISPYQSTNSTAMVLGSASASRILTAVWKP